MLQQNQISTPEIAEEMMHSAFGKLPNTVGSSIVDNAKTVFDDLVQE